VGFVLAAFGMFLLAVFGSVLIDTVIGRRVDPALRDAADAAGAWPIATMRGRPGAKIILRHTSDDDALAGFFVLSGAHTAPISANEIRRLWNWGRLRWYRPSRLGIRQFSWYVGANPGELEPSVLEQPVPTWVLYAFAALTLLLLGIVVFGALSQLRL
jgi:hypothetical protein